MQDTAQKLVFADELVEIITQAQQDIKIAEELAKLKKEAFAAKIDKWLAESIAEPQRIIDENTAMLQPIIQKQLEGKSKKSIKLPSGTAGFKKSPAKFTIGGEKIDGKSEQLLELVKAHNLNEYVITKEYVDWVGLKKILNVVSDGLVVSDDGEVLQNMEAEPETDVFYVKAN